MRARLNVLSEIPDEWRQAVERWTRLNSDKKQMVDGRPAPDPNDEYLIYQTIIGAWPLEEMKAGALAKFRDRVTAYMLKAVKEAKLHTSWTAPNADYEKALSDFIDEILDENTDGAFLRDFAGLQQKVGFYGRFNSLSQMLLKVMSPGVPDFYQGCELFDLSLVDPDNRRPVDYSIRKATLARVQRSGVKISELLEMSRTEDLKFFFILRALEFRRRERALFERGDYIPLQVIGTKQEHVCAFARTFENKMCVVVVPRLVVGLTRGVEQAPTGQGVWEDTGVLLPTGMHQNSWREIFSGESIGIVEQQRQRVLRVADVLHATPVAVLANAR